MSLLISSRQAPWIACLVATLALPALVSAVDVSARGPLAIYFIDVEGGQSTLVVTPERQSYLIDTGFAGNGVGGRDATRIVAAARDAGIAQIDYLMITHFHGDHDGGVPELSRLMPIRHFIDHGTLLPEAQNDAPTKAAFDAYMAIRNAAPHLEPQPGDRLPLKGIDVEVVSAAGTTLSKPLAGAGAPNPACGAHAVAPQEALENPRSTGVVLTFGKFRFLDVGDLTGQPLFNLACPRSLIGPVDVYLGAHHGGPDTADPALLAAFKPRVVVMNNGATKGGAQVTYESLHHVAGLEDVWQLHRSTAAGEQNFAPARIANLDESTASWIKLTAHPDGSFEVLNPRTSEMKHYAPASSGH